MLRKISIVIAASAASVLWAAGMASAQDGNGEGMQLPAPETYQDRHAKELAPAGATGLEAPRGEGVQLPAGEAPADAPRSIFPGPGEVVEPNFPQGGGE